MSLCEKVYFKIHMVVFSGVFFWFVFIFLFLFLSLLFCFGLFDFVLLLFFCFFLFVFHFICFVVVVNMYFCKIRYNREKQTIYQSLTRYNWLFTLFSELQFKHLIFYRHLASFNPAE